MIGVDVVRVARFEFLFRPGGRPFYRSVFTPAEREACGNSVELLALVFTAKEAVSKALGIGVSLGGPEGVPCRDIEVLCRSEAEKPSVRLHDRARDTAAALGITEVGLDWCHNSHLACSVAVAGVGTTVEDLRDVLAKLLADIAANRAWRASWLR